MFLYRIKQQQHLYIKVILLSLLTYAFALLYWTRFDSAITLFQTGRFPDFLDVGHVTATAEHFADDPILPPFKDKFWELGQRCKALSTWLYFYDAKTEQNRHSKYASQLTSDIERASLTLFPFLIRPPNTPKGQLTLDSLRGVAGSRGIVIPVGGSEAPRFAAHLIVSLRRVLGCKLPIQIAYAGEADLPGRQRDFLASLDDEQGLDFLDVQTLFDETVVRFTESPWAIKAFAALASRFEQTILLDADAVFVQTPEMLFEQPTYIETGAYLFHDRLLWQHKFRDRHQWWHDQIKQPSRTLLQSLVWTREYAEECDSGVVVINKSRAKVFVGLLHTAWQNTYQVRQEVSYKLMYGDKETWWLGMELVGADYGFEAHYGSMIGWESQDIEVLGQRQNATAHETMKQVCSFAIAHVDDSGKLLWYNGSLLKNKLVSLDAYEVPAVWMMDGTWRKGHTKQDQSCMVGSVVTQLTEEETTILRRSIAEARAVDGLRPSL